MFSSNFIFNQFLLQRTYLCTYFNLLRTEHYFFVSSKNAIMPQALSKKLSLSNVSFNVMFLLTVWMNLNQGLSLQKTFCPPSPSARSSPFPNFQWPLTLRRLQLPCRQWPCPIWSRLRRPSMSSLRSLLTWNSLFTSRYIFTSCSVLTLYFPLFISVSPSIQYYLSLSSSFSLFSSFFFPSFFFFLFRFINFIFPVLKIFVVRSICWALSVLTIIQIFPCVYQCFCCQTLSSFATSWIFFAVSRGQ